MKIYSTDSEEHRANIDKDSKEKLMYIEAEDRRAWDDYADDIADEDIFSEWLYEKEEEEDMNDERISERGIDV